MIHQTNTISIIIKTYDNSHVAGRPTGVPTLKALLVDSLRALEAQTVLPHEILVVDSSKGDGIAETLRGYVASTDVPIRRIPLAPADFSYPHSLNLGIQRAGGEIVVSLSGDATPAHDRWLETLVAPLANSNVAGAFSRHVARPGVPLAWAERFRLWWRYRSRMTLLRTTDHVFSNASSAFRRDLALQIPFDEGLVELEDYAWAKEVQSRGYTVAYAGESEVYHSHIVSSAKTIWRMVYYVFLRMRTDAQKRKE
jgi:rhamnosyltransferase